MILNEDNIELTKHSAKYYTKQNWTGYRGRESRIGLLKLFFIILLMVVVIRFLYDGVGSDISTMSFLEFLTSLPSVSTTFRNFFTFSINGSWGVFDFLRLFINSFGNFFGIIWWITGALIDVILFIAGFLRFIFI